MKRPSYLLLAASLVSSGAWAEPRGAELFNQKCATCHGEGGPGIPGFAPPLAKALGRQLVAPDAKRYFPQVVISGLSGKIRVGAQVFIGAMPTMGALSNDELAAILRYVTTELNEAPSDFTITASDVEQARARPMSGSDVRLLREALLKDAK